MSALSSDKALIFRITHIANVPWILANGLHCRNSATQDPQYVEIGNPDLIDKRQRREVSVPPGGTLSDYVPFYFTPYSPMLYNIKTGWKGMRQRPMAEIVILVSSLLTLGEHGIPFVFSDRHAYLVQATFSSDLADLSALPWDLWVAKDFAHDPNKPAKFERYNAEALVHRHVPVSALQGIICHGAAEETSLKEMVHNAALGLAVHSRPGWIRLMIRYTQGNLLNASAEALVNTVNEVGVMGKGIALMFREAFPVNTEAYEKAVERGEVRVGRMLVTENHALVGPRWIINFPTKKHWRHPSKLEWVREGLRDLAKVLRTNHVHSVAVPPLGCGNGGLDWALVRREIEATLGDLDGVDVVVYEPTAAYQNAPKRAGLEILTPARALIAELVRRYSVLGLECTNLEVQKLAWFLHRAISVLQLEDPLVLQFAANKYGPYADRLRHLLDGLDGSYLHCEKRLSDAGPFDLIWFEDGKREVVAQYLREPEAAAYIPALDRATATIDGFESPLGMELLATVDWLLVERGVQRNLAAVRAALKEWPGGKTAAARKLKLFDDRLLSLALERLV